MQFLDQENLSRLQRCLKGKALEAVRFRLLIPSNVPDIMKTLRLLFVRPEIIINSLLHKIRNDPAPKAEKLETLVAFALSVQNLGATMEASNLVTHMIYPMLLQELTDKLPPQIKLNWNMHKRTITSVSISSFATWLQDMADAASEVTLSFHEENTSATLNSRKERRKETVYTHIANSSPLNTSERIAKSEKNVEAQR